MAVIHSTSEARAMRTKALVLATGAVVVAAAYWWHRRRRTAQSAANPTQPTATQSALFCCNVRLCVKPERREEFLQALKAVQASSLNSEPRAVAYVHGEDISEPNTFHVHQQFRSAADFEAQHETEHGSTFHAFLCSGALASRPDAGLFWLLPGQTDGPAAATVAAGSGAQVRCLNVSFRVKPERRAEFLEAIQADQASACAHTACTASPVPVYATAPPDLVYATATSETHVHIAHDLTRTRLYTQPCLVCMLHVHLHMCINAHALHHRTCRGQRGTIANEPRAICFLVGEAAHTENQFYLHEQYVGEEGFTAHTKAAHFAPWQAFCDTEPFDDFQVSFYDRK